MIQRKQSVFLLIATLLGIGLLWMPLANVIEDASILLTEHFKDLRSLAVLSGVVAAFSFFAVFLFQNRKRQMRFAAFVSFLSLILQFDAIYQVETWRKQLPETQSLSYGFGIAFPFLMLLFTALAFFYIKKDEALVQSMDRFRD